MAAEDNDKARLFIAVELPDEVKSQLTDLQERLKKACGFCPARWVAAGNIHLTLNFLGDVAVDKIDDITNAVKTAAVEFPPFELSLTETGAFPNLERPHNSLTIQPMRVGPSEPACRSRFQTAFGGCGQKPWS